jgi:hypothetical protein
MSQYTELLDLKANEISPDDDDYKEKLREVAQLFRTFDDALTTFIVEHGYNGDKMRIEDKVLFLQDKFKSANVPVPRGLKEWFTKHKGIKRETAFQICFAFSLNVEQTNEFFRKVYLGRGFDCHSVCEAVFYYCLKNDLPYTEALSLIKQTPVDKKGGIKSGNEVLFTNIIVDNLKNLEKKKDLIRYINENIEQFECNNATATKYIQKLWRDEIACEKGLAYKEGKLIAKANPDLGKNEPDEDKEKYEKDKYITVTEEDSIWNVLCQIYGLDKYQTSRLNTDTDRSIKPVLDKNPLLPPLAADSFPDREGINKVISGKHVSNELVRKMIILLVFYKYWAKKRIEWDEKPADQRDDFYEADYSDADRFFDTINHALLDAGYPALYPGNPYDWIFMWAMKDDDPLFTFRYYMGELFAVKSEQ